jgi:hypothetical protein
MFPVLSAFGKDSMTKFSELIEGFQNLISFFIKHFLSDGNHQRYKILARRNTQFFFYFKKSSGKEYSRHFTGVQFIQKHCFNYKSYRTYWLEIWGWRGGGGERCKRVTLWSVRIVATRP